MNIEKIAEEMAENYKESKLKWILDLKRLEQHGYEITKKKVELSSTPICFDCRKIIIGAVTIENGNYYCHHCYFRKKLRENLS